VRPSKHLQLHQPRLFLTPLVEHHISLHHDGAQPLRNDQVIKDVLLGRTASTRSSLTSEQVAALALFPVARGRRPDHRPTHDRRRLDRGVGRASEIRSCLSWPGPSRPSNVICFGEICVGWAKRKRAHASAAESSRIVGHAALGPPAISTFSFGEPFGEGGASFRDKPVSSNFPAIGRQHGPFNFSGLVEKCVESRYSSASIPAQRAGYGMASTQSITSSFRSELRIVLYCPGTMMFVRFGWAQQVLELVLRHNRDAIA